MKDNPPAVPKRDVDRLFGDIKSGSLLFGGLIDWLENVGVRVLPRETKAVTWEERNG